MREIISNIYFNEETLRKDSQMSESILISIKVKENIMRNVKEI